MSYRIVLYNEDREEMFTIEQFTTPEEAGAIVERLKHGPDHVAENWIVEKIYNN